MQIELSKEQFREMLIGAMLYSWIYGGLADRRGEDFSKFEKLEDYLLKVAEEKELKDLYENFKGSLLPANKICRDQEETMSEYDDDQFWNDLVTRLGKRDFWSSLSEKEKRGIKKKDWLPEKVHEFYDKYWQEVEEHGVDRLEIKEDE